MHQWPTLCRRRGGLNRKRQVSGHGEQSRLSSGILLLKREGNDHAVPALCRPQNHRTAPPHYPLATGCSAAAPAGGRATSARTGRSTICPVPTDVAVLVVLWRLQYKLSLRNVAEMFLTRGFTFTHETAPAWEERYAPLLTARLKARRRGKAGRKWHVDLRSVFLKHVA